MATVAHSEILTGNGQRLKIFTDFVVDKGLPKFRMEDEVYGSGERRSSLRHRDDEDDWEDEENDERVQPVKVKDNEVTIAKTGDKAARVLTIPEFFKAMANSAEELTVVSSKALGFEAALGQARETRQVALIAELERGASLARSEAQMVAMGLTRFLTEPTAVSFIKKVTKPGLRLDWIKNFTRVVPADVAATKRRADDRGIFDNYAIMHYDPKGDAHRDTPQEKAARRDPILFGVLRGRRNLYFVGEWQDEFCDLTMDQIATVLGQRMEQTLS